MGDLRDQNYQEGPQQAYQQQEYQQQEYQENEFPRKKCPKKNGKSNARNQKSSPSLGTGKNCMMKRSNLIITTILSQENHNGRSQTSFPSKKYPSKNGKSNVRNQKSSSSLGTGKN